MKKALFWKFLERFGVQSVLFLLQIILARLLSPEHYGALAIMIIFTTLANVFIQNGFSTALVQNKDVTEEDYSSVLWVTLGVAAVLYAVIFFSAPFIADFYNMPQLVSPFRVLALLLFPGALNSVQLAKVSREMDFKKVFYSNSGAILISGVTGIIVALLGGGIWALVAQNMLNVFIAAIVMQFTTKIKFYFKVNLKRVKVLFAYGWKLLVSGVIDTLYQDLQGLVIGKKYNSASLGYFNRGKQFPQFIINSINAAIQSVMLPAMSEKQDKKEELKELTRRSITVSAYVMFPLMAGLAAVAKPLVELLLSDTWLPCVPYLQIYCFSFAFFPVHSCNLQAINAMGRSDLYLKLEIIKKSYGLIALIIAVVFFESPIAIAMTAAITSLLSFFVNASPNKKLMGYSYLEQIKDIMPSFLASVFMCAVVVLAGQLNLGLLVTLILQVLIGVVVYLLISIIFKLSPFVFIIETIKNILNKKEV